MSIHKIIHNSRGTGLQIRPSQHLAIRYEFYTKFTDSIVPNPTWIQYMMEWVNISFKCWNIMPCPSLSRQWNLKSRFARQISNFQIPSRLSMRSRLSRPTSRRIKNRPPLWLNDDNVCWPLYKIDLITSVINFNWYIVMYIDKIMEIRSECSEFADWPTERRTWGLQRMDAATTSGRETVPSRRWVVLVIAL